MTASVSVVFVTYRRAHLLRRTLDSFLETTAYPRSALQLIVCDDGSDAATQRTIRSMPFDDYCLAARNRGMGANTNAGIRSASGDFLLQLQDDWICGGPPDWLRTALELMHSRQDVGMIRLRQGCRAAGDRVTLPGGRESQIYPPGFHAVHREFAYSDNPHLKRREFHQDLGLYREDLSMPSTELEFCARVDRQARWRIAWIAGLAVFTHIGEAESFNPCNLRDRRMQRVARLPGGRLLLGAARFGRNLWRGRTAHS